MKIGVIGLGLIGGSIFKKLREIKEYEVIGVSRSVNEKNVYKTYDELKNCNLVFVCTPMNATLSILDELECYLNKDTIVTDVCSLKEFVSKKKYAYKFIPSHPMAGTENSGWEASFSELFEGAIWAVTPDVQEVNPDVELLQNVIEKLGANVILTTPKDHDKAVALISHAPMVVAQALCETIADNQLAQILSSTGFKDTTRLALSNTEMAEDMVLMNKKNIAFALDKLANSLNDLLLGDYKEKAQEIKEFRKNLYL